MKGSTSAPSLTPQEIAELQQTEIEAIESILDQDFTIIEQKAWKGAATSQLHEFQVVLRPDEERLKPLVCAYVLFRLPTKYPFVAPTIIIKQNDGRHKGLSAKGLSQLADELNRKARELLGAEMIWELISTGQDFISLNNVIPKAVRDGAPSLSLEEEMQKRAKEQQDRQLEEQQQERLLKQQAETERAEKLSQLIQEEASKKSALLKLEKDRKRESGYFGQQNLSTPVKGLAALATTASASKFARAATAASSSDESRIETPLRPDGFQHFGSPWPFRSPAGPGIPSTATTSRYLSDFEEVEFLGKGAFGSVVKARNRLDGRFYAVKKIKLSSSPDEDERTLREISALSRLDHPHIVRYSTCWIEETHMPGGYLAGSDTDGFTSGRTLETNTTTSKTHASGPNLSMSAFGNGFSRLGNASRPKNGRDDSFRAVPDFDDDDDAFASGANSSNLTGSFADIRFAEDDDDSIDQRNNGASSRNNATASFKGGLLALRTPSDGSDDNSDGSEDDDDDDDDSEESSSEDELGADDFSRIRLSSRRASRTGRSVSRSVSVAPPTGSMPVQRVLYIQMEFVENRTLLEAIEKGLTEDEAWRILRQMVEALAHISSLGIIHRDLKPSNVLMYSNGDVKIGDFGLATNALQIAEGNAGNTGGTAELAESADLTGDLGTFLYTAPELRAKGGVKYNFKVDVYSLGVIFFEMLASQRVYKTGMERILLIRELRDQKIVLPAVWPHSKLEKQTALIRQMLDHDPERRPSPLEILKSDLLPPKMEDEYIEECLRLMANPTSAYNHQLMDALFGRTAVDLVRDFTFDTGAETDHDNTSLTPVVCDVIRNAARRHGAVEFTAPLVLPPNGLYTANEKVVQMLDRTGRVVHLPYDLTVPFARVFARSSNQRFKRYEISNVYRENVVAGGQPRAVLAASFDIVSPEKSAAAEAEALAFVEKVLDEIPGVAGENWVVHINHEVIMSMILDRIPAKHRVAVIGVVALLAGSKTIQSARAYLLQLGLAQSTIEELEAFNLNDDIAAVHARLERLLPSEQHTRLAKAVSQISDVVATARFFGVQRQFIFSPLLAQSSQLYRGGVLFTVVRAGKRRDVVAAGGRYDALLKHFANPTASSAPLHGVGIQIAVGKLTIGLAKYQEVQVPRLLSRTEEERSFGLYTPRRCDVYVASTPGLLETRMEICRELWAHNIAADLQYEHATYDTPEAAAATCRAEGILLLIFAKPRSPVLKVKVVLQRAEFEVPRNELVTFVQDRIAKQRSVDLQVASSAGGSAFAHRFGPAGTDAASFRSTAGASGTPGSLTSGHHHHQHGNFSRTYSGNDVMPSATIAVREREMLLPERPIHPSKKGDKSQQNRPKPSSRQLVLDKASRQISRFSDQLQAGNVPILAVDFTGVNFDRLSASLTACLASLSDGGDAASGTAVPEDDLLFRAFLEPLSADEREYARLIKTRAIEFAFPDATNSAANVAGCGRVFLYSLRDDKFALLGCGR